MQETNLESNISLDQVNLDGEKYFRISNSNLLRPFFMNIVSDSNHWLFISSNGGLTAGRKNSEFALFPYYTEDKITETAEFTGSKTILRVKSGDGIHLWEPFSLRQNGLYRISRNLYKSEYGNKVRFEELNHDLGLSFSYQWNNSDLFGFARNSIMKNLKDEKVNVSFIDGIQNIMPAGVPSDLQNSTSNLVDAYKWNQLDQKSGLGIFALSAIIVDRAEPSEALKTNIAWSYGLDNPKYLVSSIQLDNFRNGHSIKNETDVKAERGSYFVHEEVSLNGSESKEWWLFADVNKTHTDLVSITETIKSDDNLLTRVKNDIDLGTKRLIQFVSASDGNQFTSDSMRDSRHFSNVLFNIMRGGIIDDNYDLEKSDILPYLEKANNKVYNNFKHLFDGLDDRFTLAQLLAISSEADDSDFRRLCVEYLPLKFSRRHGDPSRPWNRFSINIRSEIDGSKILAYEGNWRDIFQNWEALVHSYPHFIEGMITKFLNASTFDGYNPYRVTKDGFDWETIEPDDPWSYIGYWGDHQIIYLLKFLEFIEDHNPGKLSSKLDKCDYVYANVPYRIKSYTDIIRDPKDTIIFDHNSDVQIRADREKLGADGALLKDNQGKIYHVNFLEKIMATVLAKISNLIPEGGIWMNTQRPEWNDANNALVGNGVSMVTLNYLRRFLSFFRSVIKNSQVDQIDVSSGLSELFSKTNKVLVENIEIIKGPVSDLDKRKVVDGLGQAGSDYRDLIYHNGFTGSKEPVDIKSILNFIDLVLRYLDHSIAANKRTDNMYHAYNLMSVNSDGGISISHLDEMLEGQVAVLSSGYLSSKESLLVLDSMKNSRLFRKDQYSYLLYPEKKLKSFLEKNSFDKSMVSGSELLIQMLKDEDTQIINQDANGICHFNGNFRNANDLSNALSALEGTKYKALARNEKSFILEIFEAEFNHKAFTGRSGTFFGYEGLGSIYWHMVSKLLLAVQGTCLRAVESGEDDSVIGRLLEHYYEINEGLGVHKSPELYGAFSTDAYSHTPKGKGAQQPGMTGQVKEDILSRFGELGVFVHQGQLSFHPCLLRKREFLNKNSIFSYIDINLNGKEIELDSDALGFTYCQVPVIYSISDENRILVKLTSGQTMTFETFSLSKELSEKIFYRTGEVDHILVHIDRAILK